MKHRPAALLTSLALLSALLSSAAWASPGTAPADVPSAAPSAASAPSRASAPSAASAASADSTGSARAGATAARPDFRLPFSCGQKWQLKTYEGHSPDDMKSGTSTERSRTWTTASARTGG